MQPLLIFILFLLARPSTSCRPTFNPDFSDPPTCTRCKMPELKVPENCPSNAAATEKITMDFDSECKPQFKGCEHIGMSNAGVPCMALETADLKCGSQGNLLAGTMEVASVYCIDTCPKECPKPSLTPMATCPDANMEMPTFQANASESTSTECALDISCPGGGKIGVYANKACYATTAAALSCDGGNILYNDYKVDGLYCSTKTCDDCILPPRPDEKTCSIHPMENPMMMTSNPTTCDVQFSECTKWGISDGTTCTTVMSDELLCVNGQIQHSNMPVKSLFCEAPCVKCQMPTIPVPTECIMVDDTTEPTWGFGTDDDCLLKIADCPEGYIYLKEDGTCSTKVMDPTAFTCEMGDIRYEKTVKVQTVFCSKP